MNNGFARNLINHVDSRKKPNKLIHVNSLVYHFKLRFVFEFLDQ